MTQISFLGTGAMGSRMARRLLEAGHSLTVWNRSPGRTEGLARSGATVAVTPKAAVEGADVVISMVRDDQASHDVWLDATAGALTALAPGTLALECSTLSVPHVRRLAERMTAARLRFLDAPLAGSRPQAEAGQLIFFAGGDAADVDAARPLLDTLGAATHHAGPHGAGAGVKLMVNALFGAQVAVFAELLGFADALGIPAAEATAIVTSTPVASPAAGAAAAAMLEGVFRPAFPIELVAKDFGLLRDTAAAYGDPELPICGATERVYREGQEAGFGADNITGIVQRYRTV